MFALGVIALGLAAGVLLIQAPVPTACVVVVILWSANRYRVSKVALTVATMGLCANAMRCRLALHQAEVAYNSACNDFAPPKRCALSATVVSSPFFRRNAERTTHAERDGIFVTTLEVTDGDCEGHAWGEKTLVRFYIPNVELRRGMRVSLVADIGVTHLFLNEGLLDSRLQRAREGFGLSGTAHFVNVERFSHSWGSHIDAFRNHVRNKIAETYPESTRDYARALILGEADFGEEDLEQFQLSGLSHLLAVSGTHLHIVILGLAGLLHALLVRMLALSERIDVGRVVALVLLPITWVYADFAGGSGSAVRAASMLTFQFVAQAFGRRMDAKTSFAWSVIAMAAWDPFAITELSFALSVGATAGMLLLQTRIVSLVETWPHWSKVITTPLSITLSAMLGCLPVLVMLNEKLLILSVVANLVAVPVGELAALPICMAHVFLDFIPNAQRGAAFLGSIALEAMKQIARITSEMQWSTVSMPRPSGEQLAVLTIGVVLWNALSTKRHRYAVTVITIGALILLEGWIRYHSIGKLRIHALDVGQGDAIFIEFPNREFAIIDAGGLVGSPVDVGKRIVLPVLRYHRVDELKLAMLSHPHPDHFGGLKSIVFNKNIVEFADTGQGESGNKLPIYQESIDRMRNRGVAVIHPQDLCNHPKYFGNARLEVLAPCPEFDSMLGANNNSFVVRITYGKRTALLMGDAETEAEERLIRSRAILKADFIKIGHHGSRTSSRAHFIQTVRPLFAAISCGIRNRFGHPTEETMQTLQQNYVKVLRTDRGGEIVWETDGDQMTFFQPAVQ